MSDPNDSMKNPLYSYHAQGGLLYQMRLSSNHGITQ